MVTTAMRSSFLDVRNAARPFVTPTMGGRAGDTCLHAVYGCCRRTCADSPDVSGAHHPVAMPHIDGDTSGTAARADRWGRAGEGLRGGPGPVPRRA